MRNISLTLSNRRDRLAADLPVCQNSPSIVLRPGKAMRRAARVFCKSALWRTRKRPGSR